MRKNKIIFLFILILTFSLQIFGEETVTLKNGGKAILYSDFTWSLIENNKMNAEDLVKKNSSFLRENINASKSDITKACEMYEQGWIYTMPRPKSAKATWGKSDGRTTWYNGWWYNSKTKKYSHTTPKKSNSGNYLGDSQNNSHSWRKGGSPSKPDIYMFLLSKSGGPSY